MSLDTSNGSISPAAAACDAAFGDESRHTRTELGYGPGEEQASSFDLRAMVGQVKEACLDCEAALDCMELWHASSTDPYDGPSAGGKRPAGSHSVFADCAEICRTTARLCASGSPLTGKVSQVCAASCYECILECERIGGSDVREAARACRDCYEMCLALAKASRKRYGPSPARLHRAFA